MVNRLYVRLMATQCLILVAGGFFFWLFNIVLEWPDPVAIMVTVVLCMLAAAVVVGIVLHPFDQIVTALRHLAQGEPVPLPEGRSEDTRAIVKSIEAIQERCKQPASQELGGVLDSLSDGLLVLDSDLKVVYANTALRSMAADEGLAGDELQRYRMVFHSRCFVPDQLALIEDEMVKAADKPRTDIIQLDRPRQFIKRYSAPMLDARQEKTGYLVSYQDITHEVVTDQLRQEFIANASHELRTPVTSVKVLLENLQEGAKDDPEVRDEFINDAAREMDRMHDLVNDLLDLAALESGRNQLQLTNIELGKLLGDAVETVIPQAKHRGVAISHDGEGVSLEGDQARIRQVLVNLVTNAVKFTPAGGEVTVKAWRENGQVHVSIRDTGIGIPAKDLPHIFDRFFRVTRGRSRLQGGSGLGLTIVKQAIDAHRGTVTVESTEGQGTTFLIQLPAAQKDAEG